MKAKSKRSLALLLVGAMLAGILPVCDSSQVQATGYDLNNPSVTSEGVTTWDCIWFGNYWQEDTNGDGKADKNDAKTPIKWRVLSVNGDGAFLVADMNLDVQVYNDTYTDVTWETCTMRSWLNGYGADANQDGKDYRDNNFFNYAFSKSEQSAIKAMSIGNNDNPEYGTEGGNNTSDKVYLLSIDEVTNPVYGFTLSTNGTETREAVNTAYVAGGGEIEVDDMYDDGNSADWWLRSPGRYSKDASYVDYGGGVSNSSVNYAGNAVRPALYLNLSSLSSWSYAGTVNSKGKVKEPGETSQPSAPPTAAPGEGIGKLKNPTTNANGVVTWDCIWFGNYWQEDKNGDGKADKNDAKQPIKWRVLSVNGDDVFLLADKNLDCQMYNDTYIDVTWETCTMRSWLNGYGAEANQDGKDYSDDNFLDNAFSQSEQSVIKITNVVNNDNPWSGTEGGNNTLDNVYLLSIDEVTNPEYGFSSDYREYDKSRGAKNTEYAKAQGVWTPSTEEYADNGYWWLRSPGSSSSNASFVYHGGNVYRDGRYRSGNYKAARPAFHLNLSSLSSWSYAGTVNSDGKVDEVGNTAEPGGTEKPSTPPTVTPGETSETPQTPKPPTSVPPTAMPGEGVEKLKNPTTDADGVVTWDCVYFGNYWQEDTNGDGKADKNDAKQPIKWRVLSVNGDDVFLLADKNLDVKEYNDTDTDVTWETCTMRSWLNGYGVEENEAGKDYGSNNFLNNAFSKGNQSAIKTTRVVNNDNPAYGTEGGDNTLDKVYLLSIDEVTNPHYGFTSSTDITKTREAVNTAYVAGEGEIEFDWMSSAGSVDYWWLRSPGNGSSSASIVDDSGNVSTFGTDVDINGEAVRPALHLNLSSTSSWSYAGTVTSEGKVDETGVTTPTEPESTQKPQETVEPGETEKPSVTPTVSGTSSQPGNSSVIPSISQPVSPISPASGISSDPGKGTIGKVLALKLKQKKNTVIASWKKLTGVKGYQICYSTSKKWKGKKQKLVTKNNVVIKNLKKKKTYYFRIRAYRMEGTKKVYGAWSSVKKINIKK